MQGRAGDDASNYGSSGLPLPPVVSFRRTSRPTVDGWPTRLANRVGKRPRRSCSLSRRTAWLIRSPGVAGRCGHPTVRSCSSCRRRVSSWSWPCGRSRASPSRILLL